jgi:uncharacterized protein
MSEFHFRRPDKMIEERSELLDIVAGQQIMSLALCCGDQPYLVTVDYVFDPSEECFYFHSAGSGKKIEYLRANPRVWGQVMEDHGYVPDRCDHAYRSVHISGRMEFVEDMAEKRTALELLVDRFEADPTAVKARLLTEHRVAGVTILRLRVEEMTGKQNAVASL